MLASPASRQRACVAAAWTALFALTLVDAAFVNDHFDRISRGRQILAFGDRPFADFRDPGYFLTLYASAAAQALTGGGLLGEALMTSAAIATAGAIAFRLTASSTGSLGAALAGLLLLAVVPPRLYDYDKVLFYMAGLALCWRYADAPSRGRLIAAGLVTGVAAQFRYDNGLYLVVATAGAIAIRRWGNWRGLAGDVCVYLCAAFTAVLPAVLFVHATAGLPEAIRQVTMYAATEGARSELFGVPALAPDGTSVLYLAILGAVPLAVAAAALAWRNGGRPTPGRLAAVGSAVLLVSCVATFVLRDPLEARIGAAVPPAIALAAGIAGLRRGLVVRAQEAGDDGAPDPAAGPRRPSARSRREALAPSVTFVVAALALASMFPGQVGRVGRAPISVARRLPAAIGELRSPSPASPYFPGAAALSGLASYLQACVPPDARVLVAGFAPEVFFFAERGFAGGMIVFLGTHWSSPFDQQRTVAQMRDQRVPIVILESATADGFRETFPLVAAYVDREYEAASATGFGDAGSNPAAYQVLLRRTAGDVPREAQRRLPCPGARDR